MTDKQKEAIKILNELWYVSHNDGLAKLRDEDYYLLLECVLDNNKHHNDYPTDKQWEDYFKNRNRETPSPTDKITIIPCNGSICTNPFHDCVNCPRQFSGGNYTTTTNKVEEQPTNKVEVQQ